MDVSPVGVGIGGVNEGGEDGGEVIGAAAGPSAEGRLPRQAPQLPLSGPQQGPPKSGPPQPGPPHGPGIIGPQQLPQLIGQQPLQQMVPKQAGVKALYCLQQMVAQQSWQQWWKQLQQKPAEARGVARLAMPTARAARVSSFFMA
jgi:hypothetical protein